MAKDELKIVTLTEVESVPSLYRERMTGDTLHFGDVAVRVESLAHIEFKVVRGESDEAAMFDWVLAFGIKDINGLKDENGKDVPFKTEKVRIGRRSFDAVPGELLDGINGVAQEAIADRIIELTSLTYADAERLGFSQLSTANAGTDVPTAKGRVCSAADTDTTLPPDTAA